MKTRAPRTKVMIGARVRWNDTWTSATIRNVSVRGLMIAMTPAPPRGTYVEVRVGAKAVVARAMWSDGSHSGLMSQDPIDVTALGAARVEADKRYAEGERRAAPRPAKPAPTAEQSKARARAFQFAIMAIAGCAAAAGLGWEIYGALSRPLSALEAHL